jgi:general secretion pathway protein D
LFRNQSDDREKTEIILMITPRIVRSINWPQSAVLDTPVGTDTSVGTPSLRIGQTSPGALALAPSAGGGGAAQSSTAAPLPAPPPELAPVEPTPGLLIAAPLAAKSGNEFMVSVGLPPGTAAVSARLELAFDPAQLQPVGVAVSAPGRLPLKVDGSASVRFKVVAQQGQAQLRAEQVVGLDASGGSLPMLAPAPVDITITP